MKSQELSERIWNINSSFLVELSL